MLSYTFTEDKEFPLYEQLYQQIKEDIVERRLEPHSPLPSKRSLAKHLSISLTTVENAYNQLVSEGYVYPIYKKGYYVSNVQNVPMNTVRDDYLPEQLRVDKDDNGHRRLYIGDKTYTEMYMGTDNRTMYFADFSSNASDPATFPFSTWAKLNREILSTEHVKLMTNSPSNGMVELRYAIAEYLHQFRGIDVFPDNIVIGAGTETLYSILVQLLGFDKVYGVEDPGYEKISQMLESSNIKTARIPLDEYGVMPRELMKHNVNVIHTTPSHHFPTGITMPISRRHELLKWANADDTTYDDEANRFIMSVDRDDKYIIEDDYDSEFRLSGRPIPSLTSIDNSEKVIYMNTFTKSLASTIRISYMILPDHLRDRYYEKLSFYSCPVSTFEQMTLARFISEGYYEKHINRMRTASRKKRDLLLKSIKSSPIAAFSEISEEQSGLHFILNINLGIPDTTFVSRCLENGINISPISKHSFMINYSSVPLDRIEEAVRRMAECAL